MKQWLSLMTVVLGVAMGLPACGGDDDMTVDEADADVTAPDAPPGTPDAAPTPDADPTMVSFATDVKPIFGVCVTCHGGAGGLFGNNVYTNLTTKTASNCGGLKLADTTATDPLKSAIHYKVTGTAPTNKTCGSRMPLGMPALTPQQIDIIDAWLVAGAPNN